MKLALLPLVAITGLLIAAGVVLVLTLGADDGGTDGDLEAYFTELNTIQTEVSTQYQTVSSQYPNAGTEKQQTIDYLNASADTWAAGVTKLEALEPPEEAQTAHDALVQATDDVSTAFQDLSASAQDVQDSEEAISALFDNADTTAFDAYGAACSDMQSVADENGVAVQLAC